MTMFPKPGIVRLHGKELNALRIACFMRDGGKCTSCGKRVYLHAREDDPLKADMAHIRNKRMYGDTLENVKLLCHREHMKQHNGGKPCPSKNGGSNEPNGATEEAAGCHEGGGCS